MQHVLLYQKLLSLLSLFYLHFSLLQALYVNPSDCYNIHWPMVRGQLNMHAGPGGSLTAVLADLEVIWSHVIQKHLEIPLKDLKVKDFCIFVYIVDVYKQLFIGY